MCHYANRNERDFSLFHRYTIVHCLNSFSSKIDEAEFTSVSLERLMSQARFIFTQSISFCTIWTFKDPLYSCDVT